MKSMDNRRRAFGDRDSAIFSATAFGHVGAGGSVGFAILQEGLGFGYTMNRMGPGIMLNPAASHSSTRLTRRLALAPTPSGYWTR